MNRLIVASAAYFESAELVAKLKAEGQEVTHLVIGVGLTEASIISSRLRDLVAGRDVLFCCTGGILGSFSGVSIYKAKSVELAPQDVRSGQSYLISEFEPKVSIMGLNLQFPECEAVGSVGVSLVPASPGHKIPQLETLELYGVARAWSGIAGSFTAIIAATNATGPDAHAEWKAHFKNAAALTAEKVSSQLLMNPRK